MFLNKVTPRVVCRVQRTASSNWRQFHIFSNQKTSIGFKSVPHITQQTKESPRNDHLLLDSTMRIPQSLQIRHKFDKRRSKQSAAAGADDDEANGSDDLADFVKMQDGKDSQVSKIKVTSLRSDLLIKSGLAMARNKVEAAFYDSRIRINGKKISKKSVSIKTGDEIDVIREFSALNPENVVVARIVILLIQPNSDDITVILKRFKSLTIENYPAENAWRSHPPSE